MFQAQLEVVLIVKNKNINVRTLVIESYIALSDLDCHMDVMHVIQQVEKCLIYQLHRTVFSDY